MVFWGAEAGLQGGSAVDHERAAAQPQLGGDHVEPAVLDEVRAMDRRVGLAVEWRH